MTSLFDPQPPITDPRPWLHPTTGVVVDERQGRMIRIGDHWLADFASCDYLGLDLDRSIAAALPGYADTRGLAEALEHRLIELLGCEDALVTAADPGIAQLAGRGTSLRLGSEDPEQLDRLLDGATTLVRVDGVSSLTGDVPDLRAFAAVARAHGALLCVDDPHGFGVLGQRHPRESCAYGIRGNGLVKHADETYDSVVLSGGFSYAYSSPLAFVACASEVKARLTPRPAPAAALAAALEGLRVNEERGDELRARLCTLTMRVLAAVDRAGVHTPNRSGFPIVALAVRDRARIAAVGRFLFDRGIYVTPAEDGFRARITAANTDDEVFMLIETIEELAERGELQPA